MRITCFAHEFYLHKPWTIEVATERAKRGDCLKFLGMLWRVQVADLGPPLGDDDQMVWVSPAAVFYSSEFDVLEEGLERARKAINMIQKIQHDDMPEPWRTRICDVIANGVDRGKPCSTCQGKGMVGGHVGQTAETFDLRTEPCPDCGLDEQPSQP